MSVLLVAALVLIWNVLGARWDGTVGCRCRPVCCQIGARQRRM